MLLESAELIDVIQRLSACRDEASVMQVVRSAVRRLVDADGATVVLRDREFCHYADEEAIGPLWKGKRFPMRTCISGWAMMHKSQVAILDIYTDDRIPHDAYRPTFVKSLAMTPIRRDDPIGAIGAYWAMPHEATAYELAVLQAVGDAASTAFTNVQLIDSLQQAARRTEEFTMMLAHELRNPLVPIAFASHVLRTPGADGARTARAHAMIDRQLTHLNTIVGDLLEVSRIASGRMSVDHVPIDLAAVVREEAEDYRPWIEGAGLAYEVRTPPAPLPMRGDATRLAQMLVSLLDNARRFTPNGGTVTVELEVPAGGAAARLVVRDTGVGISSDLLPRIFDTFAQEDRSLDRTAGGLGLGLAIARGIAERHGGSIAATSAGAGAGAAFAVSLPLAVAAA